MVHATFSDVLWAAGLSLGVALTFVLVRKARWREYPAFTSAIIFPVPCSLLLTALSHTHAATAYMWAYWAYAVLDYVLQLAVVYELARQVLRPTGTLVRDAWLRFLLSCLGAVFVAALLAYMVAPPANTLSGTLQLRTSLFTSLLTCEMVIAMMMSSTSTGLGWRSHVMAIGQGLLAWSTVSVIVDSVHSYYGGEHYFGAGEDLRTATFVGVLVYWCIQLWQEEPKRRELSPQLRKYIVELHQSMH